MTTAQRLWRTWLATGSVVEVFYVVIFEWHLGDHWNSRVTIGDIFSTSVLVLSSLIHVDQAWTCKPFVWTWSIIHELLQRVLLLLGKRDFMQESLQPKSRITKHKWIFFNNNNNNLRMGMRQDLVTLRRYIQDNITSVGDADKDE